jgi:transcription antitermination protein NusB
MSSTRRRGREAAVQYLYASDVSGQLPDGQSLPAFWDLCSAKPAGRAFAESLVSGVLKHLTHIDQALAQALENYDFARLAAVDRNILRVAAFELMFADDIPPGVAIDEAIEIAKAFGGSDSGRFVHGVLDQVRRQRPLPRPIPAS